MSLVTEEQLFVLGDDPGSAPAGGWRRDIDDALELAAGLNHGPVTPAVAGAWAALESLLAISEDSDEREGHVSAAIRAAALVACSWPRAELTALSYRVLPSKSVALDEALAACQSNRDRAQALRDHIARHGGIPLERGWRLSSDSAAVHRMMGLIDNPRPVLQDVNAYVESAFRRLYRHRNIVLHGGAPSDRSTGLALRLAAPLVGAALDRITHAAFVRKIAPLELAAQAEVALNLAGDPMGRDICALLE
jgi:hypothetical protein